MSTRIKNEYVAVGAAVAVIAFFFIFNTVTGLFMDVTESQIAAPGATFESATGELIVQDRVIGTGAVAEPGTLLTVNYVGALQDGTVFDSSASHGAPYPFTLGVGEVIKGWDQGLVGMKVGGRRVIIVPPELGFGAQEFGPIPANSTLIFTVELLEVSEIAQPQ